MGPTPKRYFYILFFVASLGCDNPRKSRFLFSKKLNVLIIRSSWGKKAALMEVPFKSAFTGSVKEKLDALEKLVVHPQVENAEKKIYIFALLCLVFAT